MFSKDQKLIERGRLMLRHPDSTLSCSINRYRIEITFKKPMCDDEPLRISYGKEAPYRDAMIAVDGLSNQGWIDDRTWAADFAAPTFFGADSHMFVFDNMRFKNSNQSQSVSLPLRLDVGRPGSSTAVLPPPVEEPGPGAI